jgi:glycosyltransferase involved in cell wall biosynthesis
MPAWKRSAYVALERLGGRYTDVLFTQAEEDAETARRLKLCRSGVIEAIGNGVDVTRFHPATEPGERERLREEHGTPAEATVVVMVGRLVAEKGYRELLTAMYSVGAHLWIVGERLTTEHAQDVGDALDRARDDPHLGPRLHMLGQRTDVERLLRAADIFTLPSHREGMPRSIIEAMMTGLPVVATDVRGSREEVVPEETGLLVPVGDAVALAAALDRLARDAALRKALGAAGLRRARELYDEDVVIERQLRRLGLNPS